MEYLSQNLGLTDHFIGGSLISDQSVRGCDDSFQFLIVSSHSGVLRSRLNVTQQIVQGSCHLSSGISQVPKRFIITASCLK